MLVATRGRRALGHVCSADFQVCCVAEFHSAGWPGTRRRGRGAANHRSADWQSAVSRIANPQPHEQVRRPPTASRRHSRLPTCATRARRPRRGGPGKMRPLILGAFHFLSTQLRNPNEMLFSLNISVVLTCEIPRGYDGCRKNEMHPSGGPEMIQEPLGSEAGRGRI